MKGKILLWMTLALIALNAASIKMCTALPQTIVYVSPEVIIAAPGESFTVDIKIDNVDWLYGWEFYLRWDPDLLNVTEVAEGPFLNAEGAHKTYFIVKIYNEEPGPEGYNGYTAVWCTLKAEPPTAAAEGGGTLASITFLAKQEGSTDLHLYNTKLCDYYELEIPHTTKDGYFVFPSPTKLYVDPPSFVDPTLVSGSTFTVNISITKVEGLYAWGLYLRWDPTLLSVGSIAEGSFLNQEGAYPTVFNATYPEAGTAYINCTLAGEPIVTAHGNGTLATAIFSVEGYGSTLLRLENTTLLDSELSKIPHLFEDGYFKNVIHDIVVKSVEASSYDVKAGDVVSITVIVKNEGNVAETFEVRTLANITIIETKTVTSLTPGDQETLIFDWNTQDVSEGKYKIKAEADILLGETHTEDNRITMEGVINVTEPKQPFPTSLIVIPIIIVPIAAVILFYIKRKRSPKM